MRMPRGTSRPDEALLLRRNVKPLNAVVTPRNALVCTAKNGSSSLWIGSSHARRPEPRLGIPLLSGGDRRWPHIHPPTSPRAWPKRLPRSTRNRPWVTSQQHPEKCRARISTATRAALAAESVLPEKPSSPSSHVGLPPDVCLLLARHAGQP